MTAGFSREGPAHGDRIMRRLNLCSFTVVLVALGLAGLPVRALSQAGADSLSLSAVYGQIDAGTPRMVAALAAARAAEARIAPARRPPDPMLQIGLMNRQLPGLALDGVLGMNEIQLVQMVPIGGKLGLAAAVERARAASAESRAAEVRLEERERAAMAFFELYEAAHSIAVAEESRQLLRELVKTTSSMYAVGEGRQPDVLRAQVELARMTEELVRMSGMRTAAAARLNAVLDLPADAPVPTPVLPAFPDSLPSRDSLERLCTRPSADAFGWGGGRASRGCGGASREP